MPYPERKIKEIKKDVEKAGYSENVFNDDYWLYSDGIHPARIDKSAKQLIDYFTSLFGNFIGCRNFSILDIGAGAGNMVQQFREAGYIAEGCEFSDSGKRIAKEKFNISLSDCDLRKKLPYYDNQFDWSYCVGVLSMIPKNKMKHAISEIMRVTKYGFLLNIGTIVQDYSADRKGNQHHITAMSCADYWKIINDLGCYDFTSIQPPQKTKFGIGVVDEFSGLFGKNKWSF